MLLRMRWGLRDGTDFVASLVSTISISFIGIRLVPSQQTPAFKPTCASTSVFYAGLEKKVSKPADAKGVKSRKLGFRFRQDNEVRRVEINQTQTKEYDGWGHMQYPGNSRRLY